MATLFTKVMLPAFVFKISNVDIFAMFILLSWLP
jgi:hypothetical protein